MGNEVYIEEVTNFSSEVLHTVRDLVAQLNQNFQPFTHKDLKTMISSPNIHLYTVRLKQNKKIIGMATLIVYRIPYIMKAQLEDLVIDKAFRGKGIGTLLIKFVVSKARELGVTSLNFTSDPKRETANKLYTSLGFEKRDTNVYKLIL